MRDLNTLRIFIKAAEMRSFSRAAAALGVAQPTISRVIKEIEAEWGEPVFYRTGRGVELSEFGEIAFGKSTALLLAAERVTQELREANRRPAGQVTIGVPHSMVGPVIPELALQLSHDEPAIKLQIREGFSDHIERWLANGSVDIGLVAKYHEGSQPLKSAFLSSPLVLALSRSWSQGPMPATVDFVDIEGKQLVMPMPPNGLRMAVETVTRRMKFSLNVFLEAESIVAQSLVAERCGSYIIKTAQSLRESSGDNFTASVIVNPGIQRYLEIQTSQQRPLNRAARDVVTRITRIVRAMRGDP